MILYRLGGYISQPVSNYLKVDILSGFNSLREGKRSSGISKVKRIIMF
jgi:hypothetical protein